ncbi:hypothetical protein FCZ22_24605, partial [Escherichia coli]|nr:hypothetical protein [Escherichia coli]MDN2035948.1 hypothetical protein [Escherichia coli]
MHNRSVFSYLFRKRRGEIKFILFLPGVGQRAKRGVSQEASLFRILCKYLFSEVAVQAVTELDNKAAHCH